MRFVTCVVCERQLRLYGHPFPDADPAHQILSVREPREWRRPMSGALVSGATKCLVVAAGLRASQGDGDGPGICLGNGETEAPGALVESGCSDALLQCMLPYQT